MVPLAIVFQNGVLNQEPKKELDLCRSTVPHSILLSDKKNSTPLPCRTVRCTVKIAIAHHSSAAKTHIKMARKLG